VWRHTRSYCQLKQPAPECAGNQGPLYAGAAAAPSLAALFFFFCFLIGSLSRSSSAWSVTALSLLTACKCKNQELETVSSYGGGRQGNTEKSMACPALPQSWYNTNTLPPPIPPSPRLAPSAESA
jgi:hypothetical protein